MTAWDDLIKRYRRVNGLTQATFGEVIGVEQATVSRWERGFHVPDLNIQKRLRDLICRKGSVSDRVIFHRVRGSLSAMKLADRRGHNRAASPAAAVLHGVDLGALQNLDYSPFFTDILHGQWKAAHQLGFFTGDVASIRVFNTWLPACGGIIKHCEGYWTPAFLSDGEVMLVSEFHQIDERTFAGIRESERMAPVMMDELLH